MFDVKRAKYLFVHMGIDKMKGKYSVEEKDASVNMQIYYVPI
jgi:hypothetical protein